MLVEYWAWHYDSRPKGEEEYEDEEFDLDSVLQSIEDNPDEWDDESSVVNRQSGE